MSYFPAPGAPQVVGYARIDFIAQRYRPDQLVLAGPGRRLAGYLLEYVPGMILFVLLAISFVASVAGGGSAPVGGGLLFIVLALCVGWLIWLFMAAANGQSPAKQLLGMYIIKGDGSRAGFGYVILREVVVKGWVFALLNLVTGSLATLIGGLWCLWDPDNQCLWDKLASTYVAYSPAGFKPLTAGQMVLAGGRPGFQPGTPGGFGPPTPPAPVPATPVPQVVIHNESRSTAAVGSSFATTRRVAVTQPYTQHALGPGMARIGIIDQGQALAPLAARTGQVFVIGRDANADIRITDPKSSRKHLQLTLEPGGWALRDLGATNPARVLTGPSAQQLIQGRTVRLPSGQVAIGDSIITLFPPGGAY